MSSVHNISKRHQCTRQVSGMTFHKSEETLNITGTSLVHTAHCSWLPLRKDSSDGLKAEDKFHWRPLRHACVFCVTAHCTYVLCIIGWLLDHSRLAVQQFDHCFPLPFIWFSLSEVSLSHCPIIVPWYWLMHSGPPSPRLMISVSLFLFVHLWSCFPPPTPIHTLQPFCKCLQKERSHR